MTNSPMKALNKQALLKLAKALSGNEWVAFVHKASGTYAVGSLGHERGEDIIKWPGLDGQDNAESKAKFIAAASPATVLALLDELEAAENNLIDSECHVAELEEALRDKQVLLEAAEKLNAELNQRNTVLTAKIEPMDRRIAELEAREVTLPPKEHDNGTDSQIDINAGFANRMWQKCADAIRAAGIGVKE